VSVLVALLAAAAAGASLFACNTATQSAPASSDEYSTTEWKLTSINGVPPLEDVAVTLVFDAGKVRGYAGCNWYGGVYNGTRVNGDTAGFSVIDLAATERFCVTPAGIVAQEQQYLELLNSASSSVRRDSRLSLLNGRREVVLAFSPF